MMKIKLKDQFSGPTEQQTLSYPEPGVDWVTGMENAVGQIGSVTQIDKDNPYLIRLHFPILHRNWWYTAGSLTNGEDQIYFKVTVDGKTLWITDFALTNLKCELGIV